MTDEEKLSKQQLRALKAIRKKKEKIDSLKEDINKMTEKLKLEGGKLVPGDKPAEVPKQTVPGPVEQPMERPVQQAPVEQPMERPVQQAPVEQPDVSPEWIPEQPVHQAPQIPPAAPAAPQPQEQIIVKLYLTNGLEVPVEVPLNVTREQYIDYVLGLIGEGRAITTHHGVIIPSKIVLID